MSLRAKSCGLGAEQRRGTASPLMTGLKSVTVLAVLTLGCTVVSYLPRMGLMA
jgi:hypothetical protein